MKKFLSLMIFMPSIVLATCKAPSWEAVERQGRIFTFSILGQCSVKIAMSTTAAEKKGEYQSFLEEEALRVHSVKSEGEMTTLDLTRMVYNSNGDMRIRSLTTLISGSEPWLELHEETTAIRASGNAKYTQNIIHDIKVFKGEDESYIHFAMKVKVRKPSFAPTALFMSEVKKGVSKDFTDFENKHVKLMSE